MIGAYVGATVGGFVGRASALTWPCDATAGVGLPLTQAAWNALTDYLRAPRLTIAHSHAFQDASGNAVASVGTDLTTTGTVDYAQTVTGYTQKGMAITETAAERVAYAAGVGPNPGSTSVLLFCLVDLPSAPGATRSAISISLNAANWTLQVLANSTVRILVNAGAAAGAVDHVTGGPFLAALQHDRTNSADVLYTSREKIVGTYSAAVADGNKGYGTTGTPAPITMLWDTWLAGANAELSIAIIRSIFRALGWAPTW